MVTIPPALAGVMVRMLLAMLVVIMSSSLPVMVKLSAVIGALHPMVTGSSPKVRRLFSVSESLVVTVAFILLMTVKYRVIDAALYL